MDKLIIRFINWYLGKHGYIIRYTHEGNLGYQRRVIRVFTEDYYDKKFKD